MVSIFHNDAAQLNIVSDGVKYSKVFPLQYAPAAFAQGEKCLAQLLLLAYLHR
jgi:hypothetical protein